MMMNIKRKAMRRRSLLVQDFDWLLPLMSPRDPAILSIYQSLWTLEQSQQRVVCVFEKKSSSHTTKTTKQEEASKQSNTVNALIFKQRPKYSTSIQ
jgi:hypothetical protein